MKSKFKNYNEIYNRIGFSIWQDDWYYRPDLYLRATDKLPAIYKNNELVAYGLKEINKYFENHKLCISDRG